MDTLELSRAAAAARVPVFPPFSARAPWWGGDLQTLRNFLVRRHHARLDGHPAERLRLSARRRQRRRAAGGAQPAARRAAAAAAGGAGAWAHRLRGELLRAQHRGASAGAGLCGAAAQSARRRAVAAALPLPVPCRAERGFRRGAGGAAAGACRPSASSPWAIRWAPACCSNISASSGAAAAVKAAVSVSAPLDLAEASRHLHAPAQRALPELPAGAR